MTVLTAEPTVVEALRLQPKLLPRVNLLPPEITERVRLRRIQMVLAAGLVATVGIIGLLHASAAAGRTNASEELELVTARNTALQVEARDLSHVNVVYDQAAAAQELLTSAMREEVRFSQFIDGLSRSVPEHVWLKNITFTQHAAGATATAAPGATPGIGTVTFTGVGFRHEDVAAWLESLTTQKGFTDPYVTDSTAGRIGSRSIVSFTSTATLTSDALSGRYTDEAG